ncbi:hypothetical protein M422DRAFT_48611 [Sphaerobolus stellatus SS14]|uniref:Unplaced genomic scaffold SPHSTscaffold_61, whole genome shotgun sequence n=1 Tax=Sphaerobolus stellatus (strain SS14) TaxID=990650 RepID=A0A0C9UEY7_SPHS4|nr:hypothetical protein M422DRAFT_48611 [Sphaerobolus stellatus SS14]
MVSNPRPHTPVPGLINYDSDDEDAGVVKLADIKNNVFNEARLRVDSAWRAGQWLDFGNGSIENPRVHSWPVNDSNVPFEPGQLNEAYAVYDIPDTFCLCATQEYDHSQRIFKFNGFKLSKSPSSRHHTPVSVKRPASVSQGSPTKYRRTLPSTSSMIKGKGKAKCIVSGSAAVSATLSDEEGGTEEDDACKPTLFQHGSLD